MSLKLKCFEMFPIHSVRPHKGTSEYSDPPSFSSSKEIDQAVHAGCQREVGNVRNQRGVGNGQNQRGVGKVQNPVDFVRTQKGTSEYSDPPSFSSKEIDQAGHAGCQREVGNIRNQREVGNLQNQMGVGNGQNQRGVGNVQDPVDFVRPQKGTSEYSDPPSFSSSKEIDQAGHAGCQREVDNIQNQREVGNMQNQMGVGNGQNQRGVGNVQDPVDFVRTRKGTSEYSDPPSFSSSKEIDQAGHAGCQREVGNIQNQREVGNVQNQRGVGNGQNRRGVRKVQNPVDFGCQREVGNIQKQREVGNMQSQRGVGNGQNQRGVGNVQNPVDFVRTQKGTSEYSDPPSFSSSKEIDQAGHAGCQREVGNVRNQRVVGNGQNQRGVGNGQNQRGVGKVQNPVDFVRTQKGTSEYSDPPSFSSFKEIDQAGHAGCQREVVNVRNQRGVGNVQNQRGVGNGQNPVDFVRPQKGTSKYSDPPSFSSSKEIDQAGHAGCQRGVGNVQNHRGVGNVRHPVDFDEVLLDDFEIVDDSFDEDYIPSPSDLMDYDSDFSSSESDVIPFHNKKDQKGYNKRGDENSNDENSLEDNETSGKMEQILPSFEKRKSPGSVEDSIVVLQTHNEGSRSYDKKYFCLFCEQYQAKLPRHLTTRHKNEIEVAKYLVEKDPKVKRNILTRLRNLGSHKHNMEVIRERKGELLVVYRPSEPTQWSDYSPCPYCYGYYASSVLWKHAKRCNFTPELRKHGKILENSRILLPCAEDNISDGLRKILLTMKDDTVSLIVKNDSLIRQLGQKLSSKHGNNKESYHYIRNSLREMGRLLICANEKTGSSNELSSFIDPFQFDLLVNCTREVAGCSQETSQFKTPSLALKIGCSLKKCAGILKGNALRIGDESLERKAAKFMELYDLKWNEEVTAHAHRTLKEMKRNQVQLIPLTDDVMLLNDFLSKEIQEAQQRLTENKNDKDAWCHLNEMTLAQLILFNRRRQGEASKLKISDYHKKHTTRQEDVLLGLTNLEKKLCSSLEKVDIVGKRGRTVPILLTSKVKVSISILLETRDNVGICKHNPYVFARINNSLDHIRGCDVLRECSFKCGAKHPELLRSTKLRKHIATLSQILNLKDNELDILANFLGHDIRTHREYYRLPEESIQVAKMSKLLFALERGEMGLQKGLTLEEVSVGPDEEVEMLQEDDDDDDDDDYEEEDQICEVHDVQGSLVEGTVLKEPTSTNEKVVGIPLGKRKPWTEPEKETVAKHFQKYILLKKLPGKREIQKCLDAELVLRKRTWRNVKDYIRNTITATERKTLSKV
uniref:Uncharacterized protein LOC111114442 n=2 Tax=Crassostrea virginica TaxID=6565 RepID=A0A8B8C012_CRAVI|nr:uncharacterized protein LOC111114442 [Crassostrea virginica]